MPEGHTIHRLAAEYNARFRGVVTRSSSPQGRFAAEAAQLDGRVLAGAWAYGKHLFCDFGDNLTVHIHLGLLGKVGFFSGPPPAPVGALRWRLTTADDPPQCTADLRGPTACELVDPAQIDRILGQLGPDPLREDSDGDLAWHRIRKSRRPIAALLMDQQIAPGVGNIYRAELLYRHRLEPMMAGQLLKYREWQAMWADLVDLMHEGVRTGRIDTVRAEHLPEAMGRLPRVDRHGGEVYVYRRAGMPCLVCGTKVRTTELEHRNLFWCNKCQNIGRRRR